VGHSANTGNRWSSEALFQKQVPQFPKIILASASPRRAGILHHAGFEFAISPAQIDETILPGEDPRTYVRRLAQEKARTVARRLKGTVSEVPRAIVGADTTVSVNGKILGKPESAEQARAMLRGLSGRWHEVLTGIAVITMREPSQEEDVAVETTRVQFAELSVKEIDEYVESGEPFGKAGGYAIQGRGGKFIPRIEGCYFNVMGLPLARLYAILRKPKKR